MQRQTNPCDIKYVPCREKRSLLKIWVYISVGLKNKTKGRLFENVNLYLIQTTTHFNCVLDIPEIAEHVNCGCYM